MAVGVWLSCWSEALRHQFHCQWSWLRNDTFWSTCTHDWGQLRPEIWCHIFWRSAACGRQQCVEFCFASRFCKDPLRVKSPCIFWTSRWFFSTNQLRLYSCSLFVSLSFERVAGQEDEDACAVWNWGLRSSWFSRDLSLEKLNLASTYLGERGTLSVWREGLFLALFVAAAGSILLKDLYIL